MTALSIQHFTKRYGDFLAVDDLSLEIKPGEFFGFLGPNGAGKSTTIHSIVGINRFSEGNIAVFGHDVQSDYKAARQMVGHSPQEFNIDIFMTANQILWYVGGFYNMSRNDRKKRMKELLEVFELEQHAEKKFRALSGGLKRRVMLARAMMHDPELLILDEPTAGVDVELRQELHEYLRRINDQGKTILLTSHYLEEVEKLCDRIAIINQGKLQSLGSKKDLIKDGETLEEAYLRVTKNAPTSK